MFFKMCTWLKIQPFINPFCISITFAFALQIYNSEKQKSSKIVFIFNNKIITFGC